MSIHSKTEGSDGGQSGGPKAAVSVSVPQDSHSAQGMTERKARHLEICLDESRYNVETGNTRLDSVRLVHQSLPEVNEHTIDTSLEFLGYRVKLPLFISSMTGGSDAGYLINKQLAQIAQSQGMAVGMGSIRILFRKPEVFPHFALKSIAPDVPVVANLGAVQIRDMVHSQITGMLKKLEADALAIHLNPGQELFQSEGDRDFRGILDAIRRFCATSPIPVIVKETGYGIHPADVLSLLKSGVRYVNIAGSGGTNWISVESYRLNSEDPLAKARAEAAGEFASWGNPTGLILATLRSLEDRGKMPASAIPPPQLPPSGIAARMQRTGNVSRGVKPTAEKPRSEGIMGGRVLASGGIRTGMDVVKSLVLGARMAGTALPFARSVAAGGVEGGLAYVERIRLVLTSAMVLLNCSSIEELRRAPYYLSPGFAAEVNDFARFFD